MADLNIRLAASAEVTNFSDIESLFSSLAGVNADVANALANVIKGKNVVQVEFGDKGNIINLLTDIRILANRNNLMIQGLYGGVGGIITSPEIRQNVEIAKKKVGAFGAENIEKMFGGDVLSFLEEVTAMTTNPKGEKLEPLERKLDRANKIVQSIIDYSDILRKSMEEGTGVSGIITKKGGEFALNKTLLADKLKSEMYKGYVERIIGIMALGAGTATEEVVGKQRKETAKKFGRLGSRKTENIQKLIGQNWTYGKEILKTIAQTYEVDLESLLKIPAVKEEMLKYWAEELNIINKMSKKKSPKLALEKAKKVFPEKELIKQAEGEMIVRAGETGYTFPETTMEGGTMTAETLSSFSEDIVSTITSKIELLKNEMKGDTIDETLKVVKSISTRTIKINNTLQDKITDWKTKDEEYDERLKHTEGATGSDRETPR